MLHLLRNPNHAQVSRRNGRSIQRFVFPTCSRSTWVSVCTTVSVVVISCLNSLTSARTAASPSQTTHKAHTSRTQHSTDPSSSHYTRFHRPFAPQFWPRFSRVCSRSAERFALASARQMGQGRTPVHAGLLLLSSSSEAPQPATTFYAFAVISVGGKGKMRKMRKFWRENQNFEIRGYRRQFHRFARKSKHAL